MTSEFLKRHGHSVAAMRLLARRRLPRLVFDFIDGGAEDERALRRNEEALGQTRLLPRPLHGTEQRDQSIELFGQRLSIPVLIGPTGLAGMVWPRGEVRSARAAGAADTIYVMSHASTVSMEDLAREVGGKLWMQVFVYRDRGLTQTFVERAHAAGYQALVVTIDNQVPGWRERDLRNGFTVPLDLRSRNFLDMALHPGWLWRMAQTPRFTFANYTELEGKSDIVSLASRMGQLLDPNASWRDIEWLRKIWDRPLLIKGILDPEEARRAVALGVDGLIVSNHGGRQLDSAPASLEALPGVLDAVAGKVPVLMDGGVRRGADVLKTLALGARACLIGRPQLWGLSVAGEEGVSWVLSCLRGEIDRAMALCGCERLADVDASLLFSGSSRERTAGDRALREIV
jgi:isopentenyl diphosphate isomerase/L-lactate dehydrogenase-like FMN-dependent dehydrogenase